MNLKRRLVIALRFAAVITGSILVYSFFMETKSQEIIFMFPWLGNIPLKTVSPRTWDWLAGIIWPAIAVLWITRERMIMNRELQKDFLTMIFVGVVANVLGCHFMNTNETISLVVIISGVLCIIYSMRDMSVGNDFWGFTLGFSFPIIYVAGVVPALVVSMGMIISALMGMAIGRLLVFVSSGNTWRKFGYFWIAKKVQKPEDEDLPAN